MVEEIDMKQFNLDEYHKNPSKPLVTRGGLNARIVCDDAPGDFPIIAIIDKMSMVDNCITHIAYRKEGWINPDGIPSPYDLFFVSEKHEGWARICFNNGEYYLDNIIYPSKADAKNHADKLVNTVTAVKIEWEE